jgi:hypothetical protein
MPIIINGGSRRAGGWWAQHLENGEKNEEVKLVEVVGLSGATTTDLFREMYTLSRGGKATNYFYQYNINPRDDEHLTDIQWQEAHATTRENLGLDGQPCFRVRHTKNGRTHEHGIVLRIDLESQRAISDSLTAVIHERTSRELEIKFDLERGRSILVPDRDFERPDRRPKKYESFRGAETGIDPATVKADARQHWQRSDNGHSFKAALEASGDYVLAGGDRRDFVIIDRAGDDHSLARRLGIKAAEVRARMADLDPASLPSVEQAQEIQRTRTAERDRAAGIDRAAQLAMQAAHAEARGKYDSLRETERKVSRDQFPGRYDELRAAEPAPEVAREFQAAAGRATEPDAPIFDRDAASRAADERIIDAAIKQAASAPPAFAKATADRQESHPQPEPTAGSDAPSEAPAAVSTHTAATAAAWEPDAAHELAATAEATVDRATHAGEGVLRGLFKIFASFIGWLADSIAPPPPPTLDQAERMARSSEEKHEARAQQEGVQAEREARHWLIIEAQRQAAREREEAESEQQHARRREDRSYERER